MKRKLVSLFGAICLFSNLTSCGNIINDQGKGSQGGVYYGMLKTVTNLSYNEKTNILSWDKIEEANLYRVNINGTQSEVETNSFYFMPTNKVSTMKVQALDTTGKYNSSLWSDALTYTIPESKITPEAVFSFVDKFDSSLDLVNIASMYIEDNILYTKTAEKKSDGTIFIVSRKTRFTSDISTLTDAMNAELLGSSRSSYKHSQYDSAKYFIKSNKYIGLMEKYRDQGYESEVVSSEVADEGDRNFTIFGTYRLTNGNDIKYLTSSIGCGIKDKTATKSAAYTVKLQELNNRTLYDYETHELTGDLFDWADQVYQKKKAREELN